ncbi:MAG: MBL fold metallo-hydrolase [Cyanobacteria bacterium P01_G01_bin.38]
MPYSTTSRPARSGCKAEVANAKVSSLSNQLTIKFWGVRGSIPTPGELTARYGGNTACVEVSVADQRLIFDGGTGLRVLGDHLNKDSQPVEAHLFFTHTQWDRIQGFPFFVPAFIPHNRFKIYGAVAPNGASIKQRLSEQMLRPNFPIPLQAMRAKLEFCNVSAGSTIQLGDVLVETIGLNPAANALGYRIRYQGRSLVYATDTEHQTVDQNLLYLAHQADILIYDGTYADLDYPGISPTGTMPWETGLDLAKRAGVKQLILFHHSPIQTDGALDELENSLKQRLPNVSLAKEGVSIVL